MEVEAGSVPGAVGSVPGAVNHRGQAASRASTGGWTSAFFIIGVEIAERFAYYGISLNLITYLTGPMHVSTAAAAASVNTWAGTSMLLPLLGAFLADSYLGRYRMVFIASFLYILGLGMLTLSTTLRSLRPHNCTGSNDHISCSPSQLQVAFFYASLYLVALAQGGHKPCVQAFGADQFDQNDPVESKSRGTFFNWWYFGMCGGILVATLVLSYIQDNIGWGLGFGIPCITMGIALVVFLLGTRTYRYYLLEDKNPFARIGKAFVLLVRSRRAKSSVLNGSQHAASEVEASEEPISHDASGQSNSNPVKKRQAVKDGHAPSVNIVDARRVLRLIPIWAACLVFAVVSSQYSTFFTKQGSTLNRKIGHSFQVPPAALQSFIGVSIVIFVPIYDRVLVPLARKITKNPSGITMLQRIGTGITISIVTMSIAALVEMKRLKAARDHGLIDQPKATVPMSLWWLVPQYVLSGIGDVFTIVGLQEFFYDQVPDSLRSLGLALYLSIFGIGSFISSFLISIINKATSKRGGSWFSSNLNRGHLDFFYWLLAGLSTLELVVFWYFARGYTYKKKE